MSEYVSFLCFIHLQSFHQCAAIVPTEQPWTTTQKGQLCYLSVQEQSKCPYVFQYTFMFVWPSSGSTHKSPQLKWKQTFTPQQWHENFKANPTGGCQSIDHSSLYSLHSPPYTLASKCLNDLNHLFLPGQPTERHCWYLFEILL